jgi:hypothetical protein
MFGYNLAAPDLVLRCLPACDVILMRLKVLLNERRVFFLLPIPFNTENKCITIYKCIHGYQTRTSIIQYQCPSLFTLFISFLIITDTVTERIKKLITATISINKSNGIFRCCAVNIRRQIYRNEITHLLRCWTSDNFLIFFVIRIHNQLVHLFIVLQNISLNVLKNVNFSTATI